MPHSSRPAARARAAASPGAARRELAQERAERAARARPAGRASRPSRTASGRLARRGGDQHPVVGDVLDAPATTSRAGTRRRPATRRPSPRRARRRGGPGPSPPARKTPNSPRSGIVPPLVTASRCAPAAAGQLAGDAVPDEPRPQLGELVGRVAAGQHVEHGLERRARQPGERRRAAHELVDLVDGHGRPARRIATICWASTSSGLRG